MFDWPMSSPQMITMFGFLPAWAAPADGVTTPVVRAERRAVREAALAQPFLLSAQAPWESGKPPGTAAVALPEKSRPPAAVA